MNLTASTAISLLKWAIEDGPEAVLKIVETMRKDELSADDIRAARLAYKSTDQVLADAGVDLDALDAAAPPAALDK